MASTSNRMPDILARKARRSHKKSKNGCRTCRIRKVKCDERRPLCRNCERHFIGLTECDFDPVVRPEGSDLAQDNVSDLRQHSGGPQNQSFDQTERSPSGNLRGRAAEPLKLSIRTRQPVASTLLDPFETHPPTVIPSERADTLMWHYLIDFVYRAFPFYVRPSLARRWWHFVRDDELSFHSILLLSNVDRSSLLHESEIGDTTRSRAAPPLPDTNFHVIMQHCLSLLASRAGDSSAATTDHTIASVASMAALEYGRRNIKGLQTHLRGLDQLLVLRGGPLAFRRQSPLLANIVFWTMMVTKDRSSQQYTEVSPHSRDALFEQFHLQGLALQSPPDDVVMEMTFAGIDDATVTAMSTVQAMSVLCARGDVYDELDDDLGSLSAICTAVADLLDLSIPTKIKSPVPDLSRSFRLAACLQLLAPWSAYFPDPTLLIHAIVHDLKSSLAPAVDKMEGISHLLLWLLAVGGVTAHGMPERSWYVGYLVIASDSLGIRDPDHFREYILRFAPNDNYCDVSYGMLWDEVSQKSLDFAFVGA